MAPTTRAATKRLREDYEANTTTLEGQRKKTHVTAQPASRNSTTEKTNSSSKDAQIDSNPFDPAKPSSHGQCHLLELPAELRNAIFDFAKEEDHEAQARFPNYAPRVSKTTHTNYVVDWTKRPWKFFGLTQTCRQLRAEYRPLWVRNLAVRITPDTVSMFTETYFVEALAPRLIQISWRHDIDNMAGEDLTPLLQLHARCPTVRIQYIPDCVAEMKGPVLSDFCFHCMEIMESATLSAGHGSNNDGYFVCDEAESDYYEWVMIEEDCIRYTDVLHDFIANTNDKWRQDLRDQCMKVKYLFARSSNDIRFSIRINQVLEKSTGTCKTARNLLEEWGILDLPRSGEMDFVLSFENEKKTMVDGRMMTESTVRKVRMSKLESPV